MTTKTIQVGQEVLVKMETSSSWWKGARYETKKALIKEIKDTGDFVIITFETDGYLPHCVSKREFRQMMISADPEQFEEILTEIDV